MDRKISYMILSLLLCSIFLVGCVSRHMIGTPISESKLYGLQVGKTTRAKVFELFGSPYKTESNNGGQSLTYVYAESYSMMSGVYNERKDKADILNILLNSDGIVTDYSFSKGVPIPEDLELKFQTPVP